MPELSPRYDFSATETKWLKIWKDGNVFHAVPDPSKKPFVVVIPPPNVTGILHMGHALNNTLQDILVRYKRMNGFCALWMPGTDHAGIATQNVVEKELAKEGKRRQDLGREAFIQRLWALKKEYGDTIVHQLEKLGSSCDWPRARFTMDDAYSEAVKEAFIHLYDKNLIYRGKRIINWCPRCQTALSDEEAEHKEKNGKLYHIRYPFKNDPSKGMIVATTRPETMLGDTAVAVNPKDKRYRNAVGQELVLPLIGRVIKVITDDLVAMEFGTGAVKVTPAHDPNDFAMGRRNNLEFINVIHPDGRINEKGGPFNGLDRFEARKKIVAQLEEEGLLVKIEDHRHAVGHCYRCDTVIEPYLSKQWFVKMASLAGPALKAVKKGTIRIRIRPEYWEKVYVHWLENIRDWCISRQIWWGHRIPVWYCVGDDICRLECKEPIVSRTTPQKCPHCGSKNLKQDEDVLDTWFSSWLWPFATLGWPKDNADLKYFYPTNTLFTASEIIFFWVARMIMAGYEFMGKAPFTEVFIHGTVRDARGRKMSKSLGNAIDPLEIIEEYGADALRFSLIINSGQDIFIAKEKFEIGRNFANKVWNAARLILTNVPTASRFADIKPDITKLDDRSSKWILTQFYQTLNKVNQTIETFRYSEAEISIYEFFWGDFCDWYLEFIKNKFNQTPVVHTAVFVLTESLKMMHPFVPFVTEEIYQHLVPDSKPLSVTAWPKPTPELVDKDAQIEMQMVIDVVKAIRNIRAQWNVKQNDLVEAFFVPNDAMSDALLRRYESDVMRLAKLKTLTINIDLKKVSNAATALVNAGKVVVSLNVDLDVEKKRMTAEFAQKTKAIAALEGRLNNKTFVSKAPQDVIAKERERLEALTKETVQLSQVLSNLN